MKIYPEEIYYKPTKQDIIKNDNKEKKRIEKSICMCKCTIIYYLCIACYFCIFLIPLFGYITSIIYSIFTNSNIPDSVYDISYNSTNITNTTLLISSVYPTLGPTTSPTMTPSMAPTFNPTVTPSMAPTISPTVSPTVTPSMAPTFNPTVTPSMAPTVSPTVSPTLTPSFSPTLNPTLTPTTNNSSSIPITKYEYCMISCMD